MLQAAFTEQGAAQTFHVSHEVTILGISLFVTGLGTGPLLVGPLSEVYGTPNIAIQIHTLNQLGRPKYCIPNILCFILHLHISRGVRSKHRYVHLFPQRMMDLQQNNSCFLGFSPYHRILRISLFECSWRQCKRHVSEFEHCKVGFWIGALLDIC